MKRYGSRRLWMPVVAGLLFILFNKSFPQEGAIAASGPTEVFRDYVSRQIIAGTDSANVEIPVITLLKEPVFTQSDSNVVFWNALGEKVQVSWGEFNLKDCVIEVQSASDSRFTRDLTQLAKEKNPSGNADSVMIKDQHIGKRYYQARLWIPGSTPDPYDVVSGQWSAPDSTTLDVASPTCDSLTVYQLKDNSLQPANQYGWFNSPSIRINFYGLKDLAGIDSAFIKGDLKDGIGFFPRKPDGDPGPTPVSGVFPFEKSDAKYAFTFGAKDAAYTPASHGEGKKRDAVWQIAGNSDSSLAEDTIRIDTKAPNIDLSGIKEIYASKDTLSDGSFELNVTITDPLLPSGFSLSGIDYKTIGVVFTPPIEFDTTIVIIDPNTCKLIIKVKNINKDIPDSLSITASDMAGNPSSSSKPIQFIVEAPELESFRLSDLNFGEAGCLVPAEDFTNSPIVRIDSFQLKQGSKPAEFLNICCGTVCVRKPWPASGSLDIDLQNELKVDLNAVKEITITIKAEDNYGNRQTDGPSQFIKYDNTPPAIELTVQSPNPVHSDARNGAFPSWTRDRNVQVAIESSKKLYKIEQSAPTPLCREGEPLQFSVDLPNADGEHEFRYQAGDSAGNPSNSASQDIRLDTEIYQPVPDDFTLSDDRSNFKLVKICFLKPDSILDRSRIIVNGELYPFEVDACVSVPADTNGYTVSIIDFAGNETKPIEPPPLCPRFGINLVDNLANPRTAMDGFTNDAVVQWDTTFANFLWSKLASMTFCNESGDKCVTLKPDERALDLSKLYNPLVSGTAYKVLVKADVLNWPQCDPVFYASYTIIYDTDHPAIDGFTLLDLKDEPFAAESGFTNDGIIALHVKADTLDINSIKIEGSANDKIDGKYLPAVFPLKSSYSVELDTADEFKAHEFKGEVWDKAGNTSAQNIAAISYLKQDITIEAAVDTLVRADTDMEPEEVLVTVNCNYPDYLTQSKVTDPAGIVQFKPIKWKSAGRQGVGTQREAVVEIDVSVKGNYSIELLDSAGNGSNKVRVYIDPQEKPEISFALFDFTEFPSFTSPTSELPDDWKRSDSLYTNGKGEKLVALTRLIKGDWHHIRISSSPNGENPTVDESIANLSAKDDMRTIPISVGVNENRRVTFYAFVENKAGMSASAEASIILDTVPPNLTIFGGLEKLVSDRFNYKLLFNATDDAAGLIVEEHYVDRERGIDIKQYKFLPVGVDTITLMDQIGMRSLTGFLVDKAETDQNRLEVVEESVLRSARREDLPWIILPRTLKTDSVRYNPVEVSNFPNPFDPNVEETKLIFPINSDDGSPVRITILDAFGNLVTKKEVVCTKRFQVGDAGDNPDLFWDGRNDQHDVVANGGYICIIDVLKTGERYMRKIAVLKKQ